MIMKLWAIKSKSLLQKLRNSNVCHRMNCSFHGCSHFSSNFLSIFVNLSCFSHVINFGACYNFPRVVEQVLTATRVQLFPRKRNRNIKFWVIFEIFAYAFRAKIFVRIWPNQRFYGIIRPIKRRNSPPHSYVGISDFIFKVNFHFKNSVFRYYQYLLLFFSLRVNRSCQCNLMQIHKRKKLLSARCCRFQIPQNVKILKKFLRGKYSNFSKFYHLSQMEVYSWCTDPVRVELRLERDNDTIGFSSNIAADSSSSSLSLKSSLSVIIDVFKSNKLKNIVDFICKFLQWLTVGARRPHLYSSNIDDNVDTWISKLALDQTKSIKRKTVSRYSPLNPHPSFGNSFYFIPFAAICFANELRDSE